MAHSRDDEKFSKAMAKNPFAKLTRGLRALRGALRRALADARYEDELRERFPQVTFGRDVLIKRMERFYPGRRVLIHDRAFLHCAGTQWAGYRGSITLGDNCEVGPYVAIWGAGGVTIGRNVHIGDHTTITSHSAKHIPPGDDDVFKPLDIGFGEIVIGDHVIICAQVVIGPGVRIGDHAMIGANSVVLGDVPANCFYAGSPARLIRELTPGDVERDAYNPLVGSYTAG
ncbi:MAG: acyltransferase [Candidatus Eremiobacteraeota bacterium]|nr:acyltransferase [Candidatus Eremiobacteraeota bacterium]MBV8203977.1 acyltransferase [Candidatus Eremiobacteraeota bacterium]